MAKLIVIIGATGGQGGSVLKSLLGNPDWRIRGVTRDLSGARAKELIENGVEMVAGDLNDLQSVKVAFSGAKAIYAVTNFPGLLATMGIEEAFQTEHAQGLNMALAASELPDLEHYIWSTLPDSEAISGKEYYIPHFCGKGRVDTYIKNKLPTLLKKTTFLTLPLYGDNFQYPVVTPRPIKSTGKYVHLVPWSAATPITLVGSHKDNVGPVAQAILNMGSAKLGAKHVVAALEETTAEGMLKMWSEATGREAIHVQISMEDYEKLWPMWATEMAAMYLWWQHEGEALWAARDEEIIGLEDLGLKKEDLVSTKQAMLTQDWDTLC
ncbi:hypothetical protein LTR84_007129 [Exophiala bonariae]|uniref:NmrA-like domain-containing protein n=1 Tax=Exophiala bonariae TaxID=1690606 RepID=A0AAV9N0P7_9EURO|nr:hypothetical protein LTR84_007129 [Exophiala bonariae]